MMKPILPLILILPCMLAAQVEPGWVVTDTAGCTLHLKGKLTRIADMIGLGKTSRQTAITENFDYTIQGTIQESVHLKGAVRFSFTCAQPLPLATRAHLNLNEHVIQMLVGEEHREIESQEIHGMGIWYFEADARGRDLRPKMAYLFLKGKVTSSTQAHPPADTEIPVTSVPLPDPRPGDRAHPGPPLEFTNNSLWDLHDAQSPFVASCTVTYNESDPVKIQGKVDVQFDLRPEPRSANQAEAATKSTSNSPSASSKPPKKGGE